MVQLSAARVRMLVALAGSHKSGLTACLGGQGVTEEIIIILCWKIDELECTGEVFANYIS